VGGKPAQPAGNEARHVAAFRDRFAGGGRGERTTRGSWLQVCRASRGATQSEKSFRPSDGKTLRGLSEGKQENATGPRHAPRATGYLY
jgi:hypothetical protein